MRKSQSGTTLYGDGLAAVEAERRSGGGVAGMSAPTPAAAAAPASPAAASVPPPPPPPAARPPAAPQPTTSAASPQVSRLIVVANRLPVSASRDKDGAWRLQVKEGEEGESWA
jgi:uncharacterized membrane protein